MGYSDFLFPFFINANKADDGMVAFSTFESLIHPLNVEVFLCKIPFRLRCRTDQ